MIPFGKTQIGTGDVALWFSLHAKGFGQKIKIPHHQEGHGHISEQPQWKLVRAKWMSGILQNILQEVFYLYYPRNNLSDL